MRNMLALFAAALLTVIGLGWYLGWYKVSSQTASVPGQHSVKIDIDTHKIGDDFQKGEKKIEQIIQEKAKAKDESKSTSDTRKNSDSLMLPSAPKSPSLNVETGKGSSLEMSNGESGPLFQFKSDKGGPSIQFGTGGEKGKPFLEIGGGDKKK